MEMGYSLASVLAIVDDQAVTAFGNAFLAGDFGGDGEKVAEGGAVFDSGFSDPGNGFGRHHQNVGWGLRRDVAEGDAEIIAVDDVGGDFLVADLFEQGLVGHCFENG